MQYIWTDSCNISNFINKNNSSNNILNSINTRTHNPFLNDPDGLNSLAPQPSYAETPIKISKEKMSFEGKVQRSIKNKSFFPLEHELNDFDPLEFLGISKENENSANKYQSKTNNYASDEESLKEFIRLKARSNLYNLRNKNRGGDRQVINAPENNQVGGNANLHSRNNSARVILRSNRNKDAKENNKASNLNENQHTMGSNSESCYTKFFDFTDINSKSKMFASNKEENSKKNIINEPKTLPTQVEEKKDLTFSGLFNKSNNNQTTILNDTNVNAYSSSNKNNNNEKLTINTSNNNKTSNTQEDATNQDQLYLNSKTNEKGKKRIPFTPCNIAPSTPVDVATTNTITSVISNAKNSIKNTPIKETHLRHTPIQKEKYDKQDKTEKGHSNLIGTKSMNLFQQKNDDFKHTFEDTNLLCEENSNLFQNTYSNFFPFAEINNENSSYNLFKNNYNSNLFNINDTMFHSNQIKNNPFGFHDDNHHKHNNMCDIRSSPMNCNRSSLNAYMDEYFNEIKQNNKNLDNSFKDKKLPNSSKKDEKIK